MVANDDGWVISLTLPPRRVVRTVRASRKQPGGPALIGRMHLATPLAALPATRRRTTIPETQPCRFWGHAIQEMPSKWFINDTSNGFAGMAAKGHATGDFWQWVASWSRWQTLPSDFRRDDAGYIPGDRSTHLTRSRLTGWKTL